MRVLSTLRYRPAIFPCQGLMGLTISSRVCRVLQVLRPFRSLQWDLIGL